VIKSLQKKTRAKARRILVRGKRILARAKKILAKGTLILRKKNQIRTLAKTDVAKPKIKSLLKKKSQNNISIILNEH
jgi:hypothetical protein